MSRQRQRVTRFIHIRVPGDPTKEQLAAIRKQYVDWNLRSDKWFVGIVDIDVDQYYLVGASYNRKNMQADDEVKAVADSALKVIQDALPNSDPAVLVTSAKFVVVVEHILNGRKVVNHTDNREAMERANRSWFDRSMWTVQTRWSPRRWCWPRFVPYDYTGSDGRKVWSWVLELGPWWIIRERYAL